jgi:insulysin
MPDKKEKWYGTEYTCETIPSDFMEEIKQAASSGAVDRVSALHLPKKNPFIPTKLEVEREEIKEPAVAPTIIRNDGRTYMVS